MFLSPKISSILYFKDEWTAGHPTAIFRTDNSYFLLVYCEPSHQYAICRVCYSYFYVYRTELVAGIRTRRRAVSVRLRKNKIKNKNKTKERKQGEKKGKKKSR